ncbi:hypothetical protein KFK09_004658 [Dendrobium nobile]|uniref:Thioredoxin-like protein AAED1, chloroplastic n=1 Tax=Dendrobium nobile TaxID=94219 RepID=A0A8T3C631_DENNO|nr:hypothetical protein KFK09_004658 [Dendrobium nobile]
MALAPWNSVLAPPRSLVASPQQLPFFSLSLPVSSSTCFLLAAKRTDVAMGTSFSFIASAFSSSSSSSSTNLSTAGFDETAVDALGNVQVLTSSTGKPAFLKDLWDQEEGIAVVALLRHFGCICCWELASELKELIPRFDAAGVKLIAIGIGSPDNARILAQRLPFPLDYLYADPDRKAYDVLGLYHGLGRTFFNPASTKVFSRFSSIRKAAANYTISATPDDKSSVLQQGGMLVFKGKELLYARKDEGTGDHAPLEEVLNICCKVPVA